MAVVVEQTIPFPSSSLDLENPGRWNALFPLIRPSTKQVQTSKGQQILVDVAQAKSKHVHIVAIGQLGNFSSKLLDDKHVTAIVTEKSGAGLLTAEDLPHALQSAGIDLGQGVVVVRAGKRRNIKQHSPDVLEVESDGGMEQDHILHLLSDATEACRTSIHQTTELLRLFVSDASTSNLKFRTEKVDGNPAVSLTDGPAGYTKAKQATERALKNAMQKHSVGEEQVTYSVHFSDINGLSRLEDYIIAGDVARFLECQNLPYSLSHSTILNHSELARGWSISIVPVPNYFLAPQSKPQRHKSSLRHGDVRAKFSTHPSKSKIIFNDADVRRRIESGCNAVIKAEPTITEYDTIVGDGDCGYTLRDGANQVLSFIADRDLSRLPETVGALVNELEVEMGGTSGALYCIFLTALASSLASEASVPDALKSALEQLMKFTRARVGDRTMMDALIPFVEALAATDGDVKNALEKARKGVDGTKKMEAKLGRSTYLDESATRGVPDPGAYGLLVLFEGMSLLH